MKKIIAACIERIVEFDSSKEAVKYIDDCRQKNKKFIIMSRKEVGCGIVQIRIREQYNNNPIIED